jgi:hypothetical protein
VTGDTWGVTPEASDLSRSRNRPRPIGWTASEFVDILEAWRADGSMKELERH